MTDTLFEIKHELRMHGSCFGDGKLRIAALYERETDEREIAKALAKEWGVGGHSHTYLDGTSGFVEYDGKGIRLCSNHFNEVVTMPWSKIARIIRKMIDDGVFLTDQEQARYAEWKAAQPAAVPAYGNAAKSIPAAVAEPTAHSVTDEGCDADDILQSGQITFDDLLGGGI